MTKEELFLMGINNLKDEIENSFTEKSDPEKVEYLEKNMSWLMTAYSEWINELE